MNEQTEEWYYTQGGQERFGPVSFSELVLLGQRKAIDTDTKVWHPEFPVWTSAGKVPELSNYVISAPPGLPNGERLQKESKIPFSIKKKRFMGKVTWWISLFAILAILRVGLFIYNNQESPKAVAEPSGSGVATANPKKMSIEELELTSFLSMSELERMRDGENFADVVLGAPKNLDRFQLVEYNRLKAIVDQKNKVFPVYPDSATRINRISVNPDLSISFQYQFIPQSYESPAVNFFDQLDSAIVAQQCAGAMKLIEGGATTVIFEFKAPSGRFFHSYKLTKEACSD